MADTYADQHVEDSPPWLAGPIGARWGSAIGEVKDAVAGWAKEAVKASLAGIIGDVTRRTNLLLRSSEFDNAAWTKTTGVTVTANQAIAPDGTLTADRIVYDDSGTLGGSRLNSSSAGTSVTLQAYAGSIWLRADSLSTVVITINRPSSGKRTTCDVTTAWQRFAIVDTGDGSRGLTLNLASPVATTGGFTVYAWGAQLERGDAATAYIPTTSSAVTAEEFTPLCPSDALPVIGGELGLPRGISEPEARYRARLAGAFDAWVWAGTPYGILRAFQLAGYPSAIIQCQSGGQYALGAGGTPADLVASAMAAPVHLGGSPSELWSDISVLIAQPWPSWWGPTAPADGSDDQKTAAALVTKWKGAQNRCVRLQAQKGAIVGTIGLLVGAFTVGAGTVTTWTPPAG